MMLFDPAEFKECSQIEIDGIWPEAENLTFHPDRYTWRFQELVWSH